MSQQGDRTTRERSALARSALAVAGALVLLGAGFFAAEHEIWPIGAIGETPEPAATTRADREAEQARAALDKSRQALADDAQADFPAVPVGEDNHFVPPSDKEIPDGKMGEAIRRGRSVFVNTGTRAARFTGNDLACANCHLDAGRREGSAPLWGAWGVYPKYRGKNDMVNTMEDRLKGCFTYSMNARESPSGGPPPDNHPIYKDLQSYMFWLADGAPTGQELPGRGYPTLERTERGFDFRRGEQVYRANCAICHGLDGQGHKDMNGRRIFPPLWGPDSYNWGAGMHRVPTAAAFIKANMPLGKRDYLSDQEAWDVAAFINSFPRPPDPRQMEKGLSVAEAQSRYHDDKKGYYGQRLRGRLLGEPIDHAEWQTFRDQHALRLDDGSP